MDDSFAVFSENLTYHSILLYIEKTHPVHDIHVQGTGSFMFRARSAQPSAKVSQICEASYWMQRELRRDSQDPKP